MGQAETVSAARSVNGGRTWHEEILLQTGYAGQLHSDEQTPLAA
jgi:hypothetical protein